MKRTIRKITVVLLLIVTVMSFQSIVFAGTPCSRCGGNTYTYNERVQYDKLLRVCPMDMATTDWMDTWQNYAVTKCSSCGYQASRNFTGYTYTSRCNPMGQDFEVRQGWNMAHGYDIHCSLDYWKYGVFN